MAANPKAVLGKETLNTLRLLFPYVLKHKGLLAIGLAGTLISTAVSFSMGLGMRFVIDHIPSGREAGYQFLNEVVVVVLAGTALLALMNYIAGYSLVKLATRVIKQLQCDVFASLLGQPISYLERRPSGELQTRIVQDTQAVGGFLSSQVPAVAGAAVSLIAGTVGALWVSTKLAIAVLLFLPVIFLPFLVWGRKLRELGAALQQVMANLGKSAGEVFRGIKIVRAYDKGAVERSKFMDKADAVVATTLQTARLRMGLTTIIGNMTMIASTLVLWKAGRDIYSGVLTVGQLVSFAYYMSMIVRSTGTFLGLTAALNVVTGTAKRIVEYLSAEKDSSWSSAARPESVRGAVEFKDVHFKYPSRPQNEVLRGVSFAVAAGTNAVIVGPSGAGKSAIFELLLGLYGPERGRILVDGTDCHELGLQHVCSFIGYVPQRDSLTSGTVFENIAYGTGTTDEATVVAAAKAACAHEFIVALPQGYQTDLGEVATLLSGGQRQRIALARALIREPRILLLDEDKSALDADSERRVAQSLREWAAVRGATVITIAHRLTSVNPADQIIVMDGGGVAGDGRHADLLENCATYGNLARNFSAVPA